MEWFRLFFMNFIYMVTPKEFRLGAVSELIGMALFFLYYKWNLPFLSVSAINAMGEAKTEYTSFREICLDSVRGSDWIGWVFLLIFILIILSTLAKGFISNKSTVVFLHSYSTGIMLVFALFFTIVPFILAPIEAYGIENSSAGSYLQNVNVVPCIFVFPFGIYFAVTAFFSYKRLFRCYDECPKQVAKYAWPFVGKSWLERHYGKKIENVNGQCITLEQAAIDKAAERMQSKSDEELKDILANPKDYSKSFLAAADVVLRQRKGELTQGTEPSTAEAPGVSSSAAKVSTDKPHSVTPSAKTTVEVPASSKSHKKYYIIGGASALVALLVLFFCLKGGETVKVVNVPVIQETLYKGKIGKVDVEMRLKQEGDSLYGTYFYKRNKQDIQLSGKIEDGRYIINEFVGGQNTGTFNMVYDKYNDEMALCGTWSNGKKAFKAFLIDQVIRIIPSADPKHPFVGEWRSKGDKPGDSKWACVQLRLYNKDTNSGYGFLNITISDNIYWFDIISVLQLKGNKAIVRVKESSGEAMHEYALTYNPSDRSLEVNMENGSLLRIPLDDRSLEQRMSDAEALNEELKRSIYDSQTVVYEDDVPPPPQAPELLTIVEDDAPASDEEQEKEAERARLQAELAAELAREIASEEDPNKIYDNAEVMPEFPGGQTALMRYIAQNVEYPKIPQENGMQGKVVVQFVVGTDGSITNAQVITSVDPYLDKEALRVINSMPRWTPGKLNGKPVRVKYTVPIKFRLS